MAVREKPALKGVQCVIKAQSKRYVFPTYRLGGVPDVVVSPPVAAVLLVNVDASGVLSLRRRHSC